MTIARLLLLFLVAVATALLVSTVLVQAGIRPRVAIVLASFATPILFVAAVALPVLAGLAGGHPFPGAP